MLDKKITKTMYGVALAVLMLTIGGCAMPVSSVSGTQQDTKEEPGIKTSGIYDSEDAAVVVKKDTEEGTIQFQNIATAKRHENHSLNIDGK